MKIVTRGSFILTILQLTNCYENAREDSRNYFPSNDEVKIESIESDENSTEFEGLFIVDTNQIITWKAFNGLFFGQNQWSNENTFADATDRHVYNINKTAQLLRDENHPLVTLKTTAPHSMVLIIKPFNPQPDTMIRLLYERVAKNKAPLMLHLDDPVTEILKLREEEMIHQLDDLPMGKYIVCGEARIGTEVYQTNCFETRIERLDSDSKQD